MSDKPEDQIHDHRIAARVKEITGTVTVTSVDGEVRELSVGDYIYSDDLINETSENSSVIFVGRNHSFFWKDLFKRDDFEELLTGKQKSEAELNKDIEDENLNKANKKITRTLTEQLENEKELKEQSLNDEMLKDLDSFSEEDEDDTSNEDDINKVVLSKARLRGANKEVLEANESKDTSDEIDSLSKIENKNQGLDNTPYLRGNIKNDSINNQSPSSNSNSKTSDFEQVTTSEIDTAPSVPENTVHISTENDSVKNNSLRGSEYKPVEFLNDPIVITDSDGEISSSDLNNSVTFSSTDETTIKEESLLQNRNLRGTVYKPTEVISSPVIVPVNEDTVSSNPTVESTSNEAKPSRLRGKAKPSKLEEPKTPSISVEGEQRLDKIMHKADSPLLRGVKYDKVDEKQLNIDTLTPLKEELSKISKDVISDNIPPYSDSVTKIDNPVLSDDRNRDHYNLRGIEKYAPDLDDSLVDPNYQFPYYGKQASVYVSELLSGLFDTDSDGGKSKPTFENTPNLRSSVVTTPVVTIVDTTIPTDPEIIEDIEDDLEETYPATSPGDDYVGTFELNEPSLNDVAEIKIFGDRVFSSANRLLENDSVYVHNIEKPMEYLFPRLTSTHTHTPLDNDVLAIKITVEDASLGLPTIMSGPGGFIRPQVTKIDGNTVTYYYSKDYIEKAMSQIGKWSGELSNNEITLNAKRDYIFTKLEYVKYLHKSNKDANNFEYQYKLTDADNILLTEIDNRFRDEAWSNFFAPALKNKNVNTGVQLEKALAQEFEYLTTAIFSLKDAQEFIDSSILAEMDASELGFTDTSGASLRLFTPKYVYILPQFGNSQDFKVDVSAITANTFSTDEADILDTVRVDNVSPFLGSGHLDYNNQFSYNVLKDSALTLGTGASVLYTETEATVEVDAIAEGLRENPVISGDNTIYHDSILEYKFIYGEDASSLQFRVKTYFADTDSTESYQLKILPPTDFARDAWTLNTSTSGEWTLDPFDGSLVRNIPITNNLEYIDDRVTLDLDLVELLNTDVFATLEDGVSLNEVMRLEVTTTENIDTTHFDLDSSDVQNDSSSDQLTKVQIFAFTQAVFDNGNNSDDNNEEESDPVDNPSELEDLYGGLITPDTRFIDNNLKENSYSGTDYNSAYTYFMTPGTNSGTAYELKLYNALIGIQNSIISKSKDLSTPYTVDTFFDDNTKIELMVTGLSDINLAPNLYMKDTVDVSFEEIVDGTEKTKRWILSGDDLKNYYKAWIAAASTDKSAYENMMLVPKVHVHNDFNAGLIANFKDVDVENSDAPVNFILQVLDIDVDAKAQKVSNPVITDVADTYAEHSATKWQFDLKFSVDLEDKDGSQEYTVILELPDLEVDSVNIDWTVESSGLDWNIVDGALGKKHLKLIDYKPTESYIDTNSGKLQDTITLSFNKSILPKIDSDALVIGQGKIVIRDDLTGDELTSEKDLSDNLYLVYFNEASFLDFANITAYYPTREAWETENTATETVVNASTVKIRENNFLGSNISELESYIAAPEKHGTFPNLDLTSSLTAIKSGADSALTGIDGDLNKILVAIFKASNLADLEVGSNNETLIKSIYKGIYSSEKYLEASLAYQSSITKNIDLYKNNAKEGLALANTSIDKVVNKDLTLFNTEKTEVLNDLFAKAKLVSDEGKKIQITLDILLDNLSSYNLSSDSLAEINAEITALKAKADNIVASINDKSQESSLRSNVSFVEAGKAIAFESDVKVSTGLLKDLEDVSKAIAYKTNKLIDQKDFSLLFSSPANAKAAIDSLKDDTSNILNTLFEKSSYTKLFDILGASASNADLHESTSDYLTVSKDLISYAIEILVYAEQLAVKSDSSDGLVDANTIHSKVEAIADALEASSINAVLDATSNNRFVDVTNVVGNISVEPKTGLLYDAVTLANEVINHATSIDAGNQLSLSDPLIEAMQDLISTQKLDAEINRLHIVASDTDTILTEWESINKTNSIEDYSDFEQVLSSAIEKVKLEIDENNVNAKFYIEAAMNSKGFFDAVHDEITGNGKIAESPVAGDNIPAAMQLSLNAAHAAYQTITGVSGSVLSSAKSAYENMQNLDESIKEKISAQLTLLANAANRNESYDTVAATINESILSTQTDLNEFVANAKAIYEHNSAESTNTSIVLLKDSITNGSDALKEQYDAYLAAYDSSTIRDAASRADNYYDFFNAVSAVEYAALNLKEAAATALLAAKFGDADSGIITAIEDEYSGSGGIIDDYTSLSTKASIATHLADSYSDYKSNIDTEVNKLEAHASTIISSLTTAILVADAANLQTQLDALATAQSDLNTAYSFVDGSGEDAPLEYDGVGTPTDVKTAISNLVTISLTSELSDLNAEIAKTVPDDYSDYTNKSTAIKTKISAIETKIADYYAKLDLILPEVSEHLDSTLNYEENTYNVYSLIAADIDTYKTEIRKILQQELDTYLETDTPDKALDSLILDYSTLLDAHALKSDTDLAYSFSDYDVADTFDLSIDAKKLAIDASNILDGVNGNSSNNDILIAFSEVTNLLSELYAKTQVIANDTSIELSARTILSLNNQSFDAVISGLADIDSKTKELNDNLESLKTLNHTVKNSIGINDIAALYNYINRTAYEVRTADNLVKSVGERKAYFDTATKSMAASIETLAAFATDISSSEYVNYKLATISQDEYYLKAENIVRLANEIKDDADLILAEVIESGNNITNASSKHTEIVSKVAEIVTAASRETTNTILISPPVNNTYVYAAEQLTDDSNLIDDLVVLATELIDERYTALNSVHENVSNEISSDVADILTIIFDLTTSSVNADSVLGGSNNTLIDYHKVLDNLLSKAIELQDSAKVTVKEIGFLDASSIVESESISMLATVDAEIINLKAKLDITEIIASSDYSSLNDSIKNGVDGILDKLLNAANTIKDNYSSYSADVDYGYSADVTNDILAKISAVDLEYSNLDTAKSAITVGLSTGNAHTSYINVINNAYLKIKEINADTKILLDKLDVDAPDSAVTDDIKFRYESGLKIEEDLLKHIDSTLIETKTSYVSASNDLANTPSNTGLLFDFEGNTNKILDLIALSAPASEGANRIILASEEINLAADALDTVAVKADTDRAISVDSLLNSKISLNDAYHYAGDTASKLLELEQDSILRTALQKASTLDYDAFLKISDLYLKVDLLQKQVATIYSKADDVISEIDYVKTVSSGDDAVEVNVELIKAQESLALIKSEMSKLQSSITLIENNSTTDYPNEVSLIIDRDDFENSTGILKTLSYEFNKIVDSATAINAIDYDITDPNPDLTNLTSLKDDLTLEVNKLDVSDKYATDFYNAAKLAESIFVNDVSKPTIDEYSKYFAVSEYLAKAKDFETLISELNTKAGEVNTVIKGVDAGAGVDSSVLSITTELSNVVTENTLAEIIKESSFANSADLHLSSTTGFIKNIRDNADVIYAKAKEIVGLNIESAALQNYKIHEFKQLLDKINDVSSGSIINDFILAASKADTATSSDTSLAQTLNYDLHKEVVSYLQEVNSIKYLSFDISAAVERAAVASSDTDALNDSLTVEQKALAVQRALSATVQLSKSDYVAAISEVSDESFTVGLLKDLYDAAKSARTYAVAAGLATDSPEITSLDAIIDLSDDTDIKAKVTLLHSSADDANTATTSDIIVMENFHDKYYLSCLDDALVSMQDVTDLGNNTNLIRGLNSILSSLKINKDNIYDNKSLDLVGNNLGKAVPSNEVTDEVNEILSYLRTVEEYAADAVEKASIAIVFEDAPLSLNTEISRAEVILNDIRTKLGVIEDIALSTYLDKYYNYSALAYNLEKNLDEINSLSNSFYAKLSKVHAESDKNLSSGAADLESVLENLYSEINDIAYFAKIDSLNATASKADLDDAAHVLSSDIAKSEVSTSALTSNNMDLLANISFDLVSLANDVSYRFKTEVSEYQTAVNDYFEKGYIAIANVGEYADAMRDAYNSYKVELAKALTALNAAKDVLADSNNVNDINVKENIAKLQSEYNAAKSHLESLLLSEDNAIANALDFDKSSPVRNITEFKYASTSKELISGLTTVKSNLTDILTELTSLKTNKHVNTPTSLTKVLEDAITAISIGDGSDIDVKLKNIER